MTDIRAQKCLVEYFTHLRSSYSSSKHILTNCHNTTCKLQNVFERRNKIKESNIRQTSLANFDGLIARLIYLIGNDIQKCVMELQKNCDMLLKEYETLNKKMTNLENICNELDFREDSPIINGSAFQPRLSVLLEYTRDGTFFLHGVWSQVKFAIHQISMTETSSDITAVLNESYKVNDLSEKRIENILFMTQFCNKTEL